MTEKVEINYSIEDENECYTLRSLLAGNRPRKSRKLDLTPIAFANMRLDLGKGKTKVIKALLDSGASASLITSRLCLSKTFSLSRASFAHPVGLKICPSKYNP